MRLNDEVTKVEEILVLPLPLMIGNLRKSLLSFGTQFHYLLTDEVGLHPECSHFVVCVWGWGRRCQSEDPVLSSNCVSGETSRKKK